MPQHIRRTKNQRPLQRTYHFTTEGKTETMYLQHLLKLITLEFKRNNKRTPVNFHIKETTPAAYFRGKLEVDYYAHIWDREDDNNIDKFNETLENIKKYSTAPKDQTYYCYSNLTFELWLILHKTDFTSPATKAQYSELICKFYDISEGSHRDLTKEKSLKSILNQISLSDVNNAIIRADDLRRRRLGNKSKRIAFTVSDNQVITYFESNPDTLVQEVIKDILQYCNLLSN